MSLEIVDITKSYGDKGVLKKISFKIKEGEIVGLLGKNGVGKSTLMKIIAAFLKPDFGRVLYNDEEIKSKNNKRIKRQIGYLPESNPLYNEMYVREYLIFCAKSYGVKLSNIELYATLMKLESHFSNKISSLSKGYRQRVGLVATLLHNPKILILDEPTNGLDIDQIIEFRKIIKQVSKDKIVIYSTHLLQEVEAVCSRVLYIENGEITQDIIGNMKNIEEMLTTNCNTEGI